MRRTILRAAAIALLAAALMPECLALDTSAEAAVVMEASSGTVLYGKNEDARMGAASTTKIMTALVALENAELDSVVTVTGESVGIEGTSIHLKEGERLTMRELLYGLLLESGNDAASAVAVHTAGSVKAFVELMNRRAEGLGCENTHFTNPSGLPGREHYSSARDLAMIMAAAMENEEFRRITGTRSIEFENRRFENHNKLLWSCEGVVGGKTGYTKSSGRTLVTCAERDGMRLVCVTLRDGDDWADHRALYDEAFSQWHMEKVCSKGEKLAELPVMTGAAPFVPILAERDLYVPVKNGTKPFVFVDVPGFVYAGVAEGGEAGTLRATDGGRELGSVRLVYGATVARDRSQELSFWERARRGLRYLDPK